MDILILFEDESVVVINKPSGLRAHRDKFSKPEDVTVADWFVEKYPDAHDVGEPLTGHSGAVIARPGIVHRLDGDTSGVMILAKTQEAFLSLKAQFHDRLAEKEYRAFVHGKVKVVKGIIDRPIGRSSKDFRLRSAQRGARGLMRQAVTHWERLASSEDYSYLKLMPKTGRTHQLRVHLKAINHPIVCDSLYAPTHAPALGFSHLALHAHTLTITLPGGELQTFTAPLPQDFISAQMQLKG